MHSLRCSDCEVTAQVPEFSVDQVGSGRVFRPFTALPAHPSLSLEPPAWRDGSDGSSHPEGRSLILWESRTPGLSLSIHRRPDGTYSGTFGGRREVFDGVSGAAAVEELLVKAFAGLPPEWAKEMAEQVTPHSPKPPHHVTGTILMFTHVFEGQICPCMRVCCVKLQRR